MGKLIAFAQKQKAPGVLDVGEPPDDVMAGAAWLNQLLRKEMWEVLNDPTLTPKERRAEILRFSRAINASLPNHEIYEAREEIRGDEAAVTGAKLGGKVTRATSGRAGSLRADAPRRSPA